MLANAEHVDANFVGELDFVEKSCKPVCRAGHTTGGRFR
ncbi:hypothetical protein AMP9_4076 [plant metagenome]|uniref:Uncharacterized protein n=1 Tax=plant metagenome TaxID=1297885 RepID=A0A484P7F9_9ZZZZ